jgi:hypothetical protein
MIFAPKWSKMLENIDSILSKKQIGELENLRNEFDIPHDVFSLAVSASSEFGKIIIERDYKNLKKEFPDAPEKKILTALLNYENHAMEMSGSTEQMTDKQIEMAMDNINTLDDLRNFITELEHREQPLYYEGKIGAKIESIIEKGD